MGLEILFMLIGLSIGLIIGVSLTNQHWSLNANMIQRFFYRGQFYKVVRLDDAISIKHVQMHIPGLMPCNRDCHYDEKYGFVAEAGCPTHDVKQEEN